MKKILLPLVGLCLAAAALFLVRSPDPGPLFYREDAASLPRDTERFRSDPAQGRLFFKDNGREEWLAALPNALGGYFSLRGVERVHFVPRPAAGNGLYSFIYFRGRGRGERIAFTLFRKHGNELKVIRRVRKSEAAFPLISEGAWGKGDELVFEFAGQGIAYFSRPVFYRPTKPAEREYVFLIVPDTLRGDMIGAQRRGIRLTPNIDRFMADCVSFPNAFAPSAWTVPSFTSLFTALNAYRHGVGIGKTLDPATQTLTSRLAERFITFGYHGGMGLRGFWGYARGFDHYEDLPQAGPLNPHGGRALFAKAAALIRAAAFPRTFLFLHTYQVHEPYAPPGAFLAKRDPHLPLRRLSSFNSSDPRRSYGPVSDELRQASRTLYEAEVMAFDEYFGRFIEELQQLGIYDRSLIVLTSDHGEEFFEHGGWAHSHSLYNELLRVPLIIKWPGQKHAGMRSGGLAGLIDVMPTLLDYFKLQPSAAPIDGLSLIPALSGKNPRRILIADIATSRYNTHFPPKFALFSSRAKVIFNYPAGSGDISYFAPFGLPRPRPPQEWFDLSGDDGESRPQAPGRVPDGRTLMGELRRIKKEVDKAIGAAGISSAAFDAEARRIFKSLGYL